MLYMKKEYIKSQAAIKNTVFDDLKVLSIIGIWAEVWKNTYIFLRMAINNFG